jgi:putative glutamine amidotransferase
MSGARPVLGITCCTRRMGGEQAQAVIDRYARSAMLYADVAALLVPATPDLMSAREVAGRLDGVLLTGSPSNVEPSRYGEDVPDAPGPFDPGRDAMALGLIEAMIDAGRPVFGVCRGFQEINVAFGGTLRRDTGAGEALIAHHAPPDADLAGMFAHAHEVTLTPGGLLARGLGKDRLAVNSVHFQGAGRLGEGLAVEALASDGLVEAVSARPGRAPVVAVQWHPEWRTEDNPDSQAFFAMLGRALRGESL